MSLQALEETSIFSISGVKERMKEKKNGVLKTVKLNASLASKIKTKTINNSSIIKFSLKQNNKALALALNAAKAASKRLTEEKMLLQKEVELCYFENASLRQKLFHVNKYINEIHQYMNSHLQMAIKLSKPSENGSRSVQLDARGHSWTDNITGNQDGENCPIRAMPVSMRIPLSLVDDEDGKNGKGKGTGFSASLQTLPSDMPAPAYSRSEKSVPAPVAEKSSSSHLTDVAIASCEKNVQMLTEVDGTALALDLDTSFGENLLRPPRCSRSCLLSILNKSSPLQQCEVTTRPSSDSVLLFGGHVTQRKKRRTGLSAASEGDSQKESSDLLDIWTKESEQVAKEHIEVSQAGELSTLSTNNNSHEAVRTNETRAVKKVSAGNVNRNFSAIGQPKGHWDDYNNGRRNSFMAAPPRTSEANSSKINIPEPARHTKTSLNNADDSNALIQEAKKRTFLGKMKSLESHFQSAESSSLSTILRQDEKSYACNVKHTSPCSDQTRGCRRTNVLDAGPLEYQNNCAPIAHEGNAPLGNLEDLGIMSQSPELSLLSNKAPLHALGTKPLVGFQKRIPSKEATLDLNVKHKKPKKTAQEICLQQSISEMELQSFNADVHSQIQAQETKAKGHKCKTVKGGKDSAGEEHGETDMGLSAQRVKKRKTKNMRVTFQSTSQADETSVFSLGSSDFAFLGSLADDASPSSNCRNSANPVSKVQGSSTIENISLSSSNKTKSDSSDKKSFDASSHVVPWKKKKDSFLKLKERTYPVNYVTEENVASVFAVQSSEEHEITSADQAGCLLLHISGSRTQRDSSHKDPIKAPPLADFVAVCPNTLEPSAVGHSETTLPRSCSPENKVLKNLTNSTPLEAAPTRPRRQREKVSYAEPKLNSKLRRGDPFTNTDFLSSPVYKAKSKKLTRGSGKFKKTKEKEIEPSCEFLVIP